MVSQVVTICCTDTKKETYVQDKQRSYQRWLNKKDYKTEMKFWAVLGSQGCREKKLPTAISMQLFGVGFFFKYCSVCTKKLHNIKLRKILKKSLKNEYRLKIGYTPYLSELDFCNSPV